MDKIEIQSETKTFTIQPTTAPPPPKVPTWWLLVGLGIAGAIGTIAIIAIKKRKR